MLQYAERQGSYKTDARLKKKCNALSDACAWNGKIHALII